MNRKDIIKSSGNRKIRFRSPQFRWNPTCYKGIVLINPLLLDGGEHKKFALLLVFPFFHSTYSPGVVIKLCLFFIIISPLVLILFSLLLLFYIFVFPCSSTIPTHSFVYKAYSIFSPYVQLFLFLSTMICTINTFLCDFVNLLTGLALEIFSNQTLYNKNM